MIRRLFASLTLVALLCLGLSFSPPPDPVTYYVNTAAAAGGDGTTTALTGAHCAWQYSPGMGSYVATELVSNGGFASATTGWGCTNGTIASVAGGQSGNCLQLTRASGDFQVVYQTIATLTIGQQYVFSGYVKSGTSGDEAFYFNVAKTGGGDVYDSGEHLSSDTWTQYTVSFTALATSYDFNLYKYTATAGTMLFDTASLQVALGPGDSILFARGCTWREQLTIPSSGSAGLPITFGAYGTGDAPIIYGSIAKNDAVDWTQESGSVTRWLSDLEENDWSEWTTAPDASNHWSISTTQKHGGSYAIKWESDLQGSGVIHKTGIGDYANATLSFWIYPDAVSAGEDCLWTMKDAAGNNNFYFTFDSISSAMNIKLTGVNDAAATVATSFYALTMDAWNQVEVVQVTSTDTNGTLELKIGGVSKETLSNIDNDGCGQMDHFDCEMYYTGTLIYLDDISVSTGGGDTNLWYVPSISTNPNVVWRDGARMTKCTNKTDLNLATEWWLDDPNDRVYVYSGASAPTVGGHIFEIPQRDYCITSTDHPHITVDGLSLKYSNSILLLTTVSAADANNWTVSNCTGVGAWRGGLYATGDASFDVDSFNADTNTLSDIGGRGTSYWDGCPIQLSYGSAFSIHHNTITLAAFTGMHNYTAGIAVFYTSDVDTNSSIHGNTISGTNTTATQASGMVFGDIHYVDIYQNNISGSYAFGIWTDETSLNGNDGSFYCTYYRNIIDLGAGSYYGMNVEVSSNDSIYYNIVDVRDTTHDAWALWMGVGATAGDASSTVYNNVLITGGGGICAQFGSSVYARYIKNLTVNNNIFYYDDTGGACLKVDKEDSGDNGHSFDYNCYWSAGTEAYIVRWFATSYASLALFKAAEAAQEIQGIEQDPLMVSFATSDFTLQSTSPCINAGTDVGLTEDYAGRRVPQGPKPDIGAYERLRRTIILFMDRSLTWQ